MTTKTFTIRPLGEFSLRESALFGFGQRMRPAGVGARDTGSATGAREPDFDGVMRLAFCADGSDTDPFAHAVGVEVRQDDAGDVQCVVHGDVSSVGDLAAVQAQLARVLSLDHDARGYAEVGTRDPVIAQAQAAAPGLRPPLFHSPYEAAVWSVLSARRPGWQADRLRTELNRAHGTVFELAGEQLAALPSPAALLALDAFPGIDAQRLQRLGDVARFAAAGGLGAELLRLMDPAEAMRHVQQINGIGPFYAALIVLRATGVTDVLPTNEPRVLEMASRLYGLSGPPSVAEFERIADAWRPWRTWCSVLLRAAGSRVLEAAV